jgi:uncharacterized protein YcaQ
VRVEGWRDQAYAHPDALRARRGETQPPRLLSPFDSLVWERPRLERLFGVTWKLEAYTPKDQREHGYFSMPLVAGGRIAGRADPKRAGPVLVARHVSLDDAAAVEPMAEALREAASWVGGTSVRVEKVRPASLRAALVRAL